MLAGCRASKNQAIRSTFIAEDPKSRPKARLSWYHPDDTVRLGLKVQQFGLGRAGRVSA